MKKYLALFIAVILAFSLILTACTEAPQSSSSEESSVPESSANEPESSPSEPESSPSEPESSASEPESSASEPEESSPPEKPQPKRDPIIFNTNTQCMLDEIGYDYLILRCYLEGYDEMHIKVTNIPEEDLDTFAEHLKLYDAIYLKGTATPLEKPIPCHLPLISSCEYIYYSIDYSCIEEFSFDPDSTDYLYGTVLAVADDYILVTSSNKRIIKIHTENPDKWCVDDHIRFKGPVTRLEYIIEYETTTEDIETNPSYAVGGKPVIYLYPEEEMEVEVSLDLIGEFTCVYPEYNDSWKVTAQPDGTLTDALGREYYCLYWEAEFYRPLVDDTNIGFMVKGEDTAEFLREKLLQIGLSEREANEFIIYWLPQMQHNNYNYIYFSFDEYEEVAKLNVSGNPDTVIRFMMVWEGLEEARPVIEQELPETPERVGFTVVEWGGSER